MVFRYDRTRDAVVDDVTGAIVRAEGRPGEVRHQRYASYELKGNVLQIPYYYFNKEVLDKTDRGLRKARRPYKAIIPKSRVNFDKFSSFFFSISLAFKRAIIASGEPLQINVVFPCVLTATDINLFS